MEGLHVHHVLLPRCGRLQLWQVALKEKDRELDHSHEFLGHNLK